MVRQGCPGHLLVLSKNLGVQCVRKCPTQPLHVTSERRSQVGRSSSWRCCLLPSFGTSREKQHFSPRLRGPGLHGSRGEEARHPAWLSPRRGVGAPRPGGRAVTARPSLPSPPPGFLRRPRPPCCCRAEAVPAEPSRCDRLRNRSAAAGLTTDPAAARQGLPRAWPRPRAGAEERAGSRRDVRVAPGG